ncbi:uncharacterized protein [Mytilus edulis]|uniref:uncharacterized protein n=1 Tax=Mytilus edulis TaxID=6550 RepID=UPI0039EE696E
MKILDESIHELGSIDEISNVSSKYETINEIDLAVLNNTSHESQKISPLFEPSYLEVIADDAVSTEETIESPGKSKLKMKTLNSEEQYTYDIDAELCFVSSLLRDESDYGCFVFVECPPGEEVKPCLESNEFYCKQCLPGYKQPNYVTSNQHHNTCFKPERPCLSQDLTYSRKDEEYQGFCDSLNGCKCNTNHCYYGDPCLCNFHNLGCPVNTSLVENGVCQPCNPGTAKNNTGCGPCRAVSQKIHSLPGNVSSMVHTKQPLMPTMETITNSMKEGTNDTTSRSNPMFNERTFMAM